MSEAKNSSFGPFAILAEGTRVGRYRVVSRLGSGGMGDVYLAEDIELDRQVALKFISPTLGSDHNSKTRFVREAQAAAKLNHPNIVTIHEVGEFNGLPFIAMEYVEGQSLKRLIEKEDLPVERVLDISLQLCQGLAAAHSAGIVHRDIKPNNILINNDGLCKILDFGLAMMQGADSLTKTGSTLGTINYMSPEQVLGKGVDVRSDIFSFGVVLYEMLTGALPFHGDMEAIVMYAIANENADLLSKHKPDIPDDLQMIVDKALQKSPEDRYQSVSEMATDLSSLKSGSSEGQLIAEAGKPFRLHAPASRKRKIIFAAMAILIIAAAIALFFINPFKSSEWKLKRVVVVPFKNQTGNAALDPLGRMVADWTTQSLGQVEWIETVAPEKLPNAEKQENTKEIADATGANIIVMGSYYLVGDSIQFQAKVLDKNNELLQAIDPISSLTEKPMDGVENVRQKVMGALAVLSDTFLDPAREGSKPPSYEAYRQFIQGKDLFDGKTDKGVNDWAGSIKYFEKAYAMDTTFLTSVFYIMFSNINLGQYAQTDSIQQFLELRRDRLNHTSQLSLDELRYELAGDLLKALNVARELAKFKPITLNYYTWGRDAFFANRPRECIEALNKIDPKDPKAWANIWTFLGNAYHLIGEYQNELETARFGLKQYPTKSAFFLLEIQAFAAKGKMRELRKVLEELGEFDHDIGGNLRFAAQELRIHGQEDTAMAIYDEAIRWYGNLPAEEMKPRRFYYALALYEARRWQQAESIFEELVGDSSLYFERNIIDFVDIGAISHIGCIAAREGNKAKALEFSELLKNIKRTYLFGGLSYHRARIAAILGDKEQAVSLLKEGAQRGYADCLLWRCDFDLESLRDYPPFQEFIKPKG